MKNLRRVRENKALSLRDIAADLDINYSIVSLWERGLRTPSEVNVKKLEEYFDESIEYLMTSDEHAMAMS